MVVHHIVLQGSRHITRVEIVKTLDFDVGEPLLIDWRTPQCASDRQIDALFCDRIDAKSVPCNGFRYAD